MDVVRVFWVSLITCAVVACAAEQAPPAPPGEPGPTTAAAEDRSGADRLDLPGASVIRPTGWEFRQPSSSMRLAEAAVEGPGGVAVLTVFFFGSGGGGGVDANLQRWAGQIEAEAEAVRNTFTVNGFNVSTIEIEGTQLPSRMGTGPSEPVPGSKLYGAVIEGEGGPWFFKLTGPSETVEEAGPAFDQMLRSIRR
jgi:hypothetical protein